MTALTLLYELGSAGFTVEARGTSLIVAPASRLTTEQKEAIRAHKPALLAIVGGEPDEPSVMERAIAAGWAPDFDGKTAVLASVVSVDVFGREVFVDAKEHEQFVASVTQANEAARERWQRKHRKAS